MGLLVVKRLGRYKVELSYCEAEPLISLLIVKRLSRYKVEPNYYEAEPFMGLSVVKRLGKYKVEPSCYEVELSYYKTELSYCGAGLSCYKVEFNCSLLRLQLIILGLGSLNKFSGSPSWRLPLFNPSVYTILTERDPFLSVFLDFY